MKLKRGKDGRFVKGSMPPLKGRRMPLWWRMKDSAGKKQDYIEHPEVRKRLSSVRKNYYKIKGNREKARKIRNEFLKRNPWFRVVLRQEGIKFAKEHTQLRRIGKEYWNDENKRKQRSKEMKEFWTVGKRKEQSILKKKQYKTNPELRKKIDRIVTEWWKEHPLERKKRAAKIKKFFMKNPAAFREFLKHGKNPLKHHLRTRQGFLVRSKGEQEIANCLYANNIVSLYESIDLMIKTKQFKGNICNPDFYIPSLNIFIEFYGGYPTAWKKKVLKNKIYKAHKIPVLGITPAELKDLDYYLLKQGKQLSQTKAARKFDIKKWID